MKWILRTNELSLRCFTRGDYAIGITSYVLFPIFVFTVWYIEKEPTK